MHLVCNNAHFTLISVHEYIFLKKKAWIIRGEFLLGNAMVKDAFS